MLPFFCLFISECKLGFYGGIGKYENNNAGSGFFLS
jgi:hypothetical protein